VSAAAHTGKLTPNHCCNSRFGLGNGSTARSVSVAKSVRLAHDVSAKQP
jgi:hypothetical protein